MKKSIIFAVIAIVAVIAVGVLSSCGGKTAKQDGQKVGDYTVIAKPAGIEVTLGDATVAYAQDAYESASWDAAHKALLLKKGNVTNLVVGEWSVLEGEIKSMSPAEEAGYTLIDCADGLHLWKTGERYIIGAFPEIHMVGKYVFFRGEDGWGGTTTDQESVAPRRFKKIYVVLTSKDPANRAVLVKNAQGWKLYDKDGVSDGAPYDLTDKELSKELKGFDTSKPYGVLKTNWDL